MYKSILVFKLLNQDSKITNYMFFLFILFFRYERHICIRCSQTHTVEEHVYIANRSMSG